MLHPRAFQVNEAWIVFKLNDAPISTMTDGDFNVIALMDAASCFILGTESVPTVSTEPSAMDANRLIQHGKSHKRQLPKTLYVPEHLAADILCAEATRYGIAVIRVPEEQIVVFIREAREGFKEHLGGSSFR